MCYYAPLRSKKCGIGTPTVTIKKQQTLEQVLYRVPEHCIRAIKTATSYTDRTKTITNTRAEDPVPLAPPRKQRRQALVRRRNCLVPSCSQEATSRVALRRGANGTGSSPL